MPQDPGRDRSGGREHRRAFELTVGKLVEKGHEGVQLAGTKKHEVLGCEQLRELVGADRCRVHEGLLAQPVGEEPVSGAQVKLRGI